METDKDEIIEMIKEKINMEAEAIKTVAVNVDSAFVDAIMAILECRGRVVVTGLGKTGHIAKKIAASFASLGTLSFFLHSDEALHGDLGMVDKSDVVIMISNSGKSREILDMLPTLHILEVKTISITKDPDSPLAKGTDIVLNVDAGNEIDHMNLAPTASSTAALAVGDALATVVSELKGFRRQDYALSHPGGALGQQLINDYLQRIKTESGV